MYYTHPSYQTSIVGKNCAYYIRIFTVPVCVCLVDVVTPGSPMSDCPLLDSDRDTTFDDFDLENDERLEVTEMFHGSSDRDLSRSRQGHRRSESDADSSLASALFSIDIPTSRFVCLFV